MVQLWNRLLHRRAPGCDPMATLELQVTLTRLLLEMRRTERHVGFAAAHHARAAQLAYESTLRTAVRHAGGEDRAYPPHDVVGLELDLATRGWLW